MENKPMLPSWLAEYRSMVDVAMREKLEERYRSKPACESERAFRECVTYAIGTPGKRIRPILFMLWYEIASRTACPDRIIRAACWLECLHAYTLVHDDLPCMDNDETRRWMPTVWKAFGEYQAVLAGDALQSMWLEFLCETGNTEALLRICRMAWDIGIVLGQAKDMDPARSVKRLEDLELLHRQKTGRFIRESIACGWIIGGATGTVLEALESYGEAIGLAFQIRDDIIDATVSSEIAGKKTGKDGEKGYVYFLWLEWARNKLSEITESARMSASSLQSGQLDELALYIANRTS